MPVERTLLLFKPGVLGRRILGEVITRIERKGFEIIAAKLMKIPRSLAETHYAEHRGKPFFESIVEFMSSAPVLAMVVERKDAISVLRAIVGATDPDKALPGTIRGDFGVLTQENIIHASDSPASAAREIDLFFSKSEILPWGKEDGA